MNNIEELKKAALAVLELTDVKGCWQSSLLETKDRGAVHAIVTEHGDNICEATGDTVIDSVIIDYIESASPAAMLDLIAQLEAAQKEITDWRSVAEAAAQDDADWHKLVDSKNDVISHLASGIINLKAAQKENANDNKLKYISRLEAEKQTEANTINLQRRMNLELMTENAGLKKRAKKAEAELSAAQKEVGAAAYRIHELESQWENRAPTSFAYDAACSALHIYQERAEKAEAALSAANEKLSKPVEFPDCDIGAVSHMAHWYSEKQCEAWVAGVEFSKKQIIKAGFTVEGE
ncbi:hypothetical protein B7R70_07625 [Yersinia pseudotuberculosis]|uniref:hypothetical protein n=1 Tax=Yersinia pseudotuberculosis TaxID=633 RepID=UPI0005E59A4A|nr:hypothetical protein [Yersinia pseudotuberculosis]PSH17654.1 hypothetical protein BLA52_13145 [Yersinia pseudotuberculosis]PSH27831.1 hypothetical protein BLA50_03320 [Yersinia pseudotuberculosis]PSH32895.1 hypothetical protein BLA51_03285 [Yersinia pseudotuberculosis]PSH33452.1 hypothetical protein BA197_15510 [Yersinia pseudotuberculosis]PST80102.1 hypothetical protein B7R70_07625 [Yersinia pseudotuberculosis]